MFIEEMEILIECKRLVEDLLVEKKKMAEYLYKTGKDTRLLELEIARLEGALEGKRGYRRFNKED